MTVQIENGTEGGVRMINAVMEGAAAAIRSVFGGSCRISDGKPGPDSSGPAFYLRCTGANMEKQLGGRRRMNVTLSVWYEPGAGENGQETREVLERLLPCLELITVAGKRVRGVAEYKENPDGAADQDRCAPNVTAAYSLFLNKVQTDECMESYVRKEVVKK